MLDSRLRRSEQRREQRNAVIGVLSAHQRQCPGVGLSPAQIAAELPQLALERVEEILAAEPRVEAVFDTPRYRLLIGSYVI